MWNKEVSNAIIHSTHLVDAEAVKVDTICLMAGITISGLLKPTSGSLFNTCMLSHSHFVQHE